MKLLLVLVAMAACSKRAKDEPSAGSGSAAARAADDRRELAQRNSTAKQTMTVTGPDATTLSVASTEGICGRETLDDVVQKAGAGLRDMGFVSVRCAENEIEVLLIPAAAPAVTPPDAAPAAVISVRAIDLAEAYKENEVGADEKYRGKIVRVTGQVRRVGKDALDEPYVMIATALGDIQAEVASGAGALKRLQAITVRCECKGLSLGTLLLADCVLE